MQLIDIHLDLAMNALEWNRDLRRNLEEIRLIEKEMRDKPDRGKGTVCFPEMQKGEIWLCVGTLIARHSSPGHPFPGWASQEQAWAHTQGQLAWYRAMEESGELRIITNRTELKQHQRNLETHLESRPPIGVLLSLEGADSLVTLAHLERNYESGLRLLGPAHYGPGVYAPGTEEKGPLTPKGRELLKEMDGLGMILDSTHLTDDGFIEAFDLFQGPIWASHCLCRSLTPHQRQVSDGQIRMLLDRGGVIGMAFDAWMMVPDWKRGISKPAEAGLTLERIADHVDHICQIAGQASQVAIGSDLDGGFGLEQSPSDLNSIADLQKIQQILADRGYRQTDIEAVFFRNAFRFLTDHLP